MYADSSGTLFYTYWGSGGDLVDSTATLEKQEVSFDNIFFDKYSITLPVGDSENLQVLYEPEYTTDSKEISWSSDNPSVAMVNDGKITAVSAGHALITATVGVHSVSCDVYVVIPCRGITLDADHITIDEKGESVVLNAQILPSNATNQNLIWASTSLNVATVDEWGIVTALEEGETTIIVETEDGGFTASCVIEVEFQKIVAVTELRIDKTQILLTKQGETEQVNATVSPVNASNKEVVWTSSETKVATVDDTGRVTAIANGETIITAALIEEKKTATCVVRVQIAESKEMNFTDVQTGAWFYEYVKEIYDRGIMTGLDETHFGPAENLSRAQFTTILYRMDGSSNVSYSKKFADVPENTFFTIPVIWANQCGIVTGYANGLFGPADELTREQMAVMMYRYAQYKKYDVSSSASLISYPDNKKVSSFAVEQIKWAVGTKMISGDNGKINPQGTASRAQCATIISRFLQYYDV